MSRIKERLEQLRQAKKKAMVVYLTAGDPNFDDSLRACCAAVDAGADILEVGVPFSDPVADGPVIQEAMQRSLAAGGGLSAALELVSKVRAYSDVPIVLFGYLNPLLWHGFADTCAQAKRAGVDGLLVVDVPPKEATPLVQVTQQHQLDWIGLVSPTTPVHRLRQIAQLSSGFVYIISMLGVTGGDLQQDGNQRLQELLQQTRQEIDLPLCVGFGIRDQNSARRAAALADGIVAGTVVIEALRRGMQNGEQSSQAIHQCLGELRRGLEG